MLLFISKNKDAARRAGLAPFSGMLLVNTTSRCARRGDVRLPRHHLRGWRYNGFPPPVAVSATTVAGWAVVHTYILYACRSISVRSRWATCGASVGYFVRRALPAPVPAL